MSVPGLIWMREDQPPRPGLSRGPIVSAAIELADAEGVQALSMRRIAVTLGAGTMSLYRHVPGKDELLDLMVDAALGEMPPKAPSGDWRADIRLFAARQRELSLRHPWLAELLIGKPPLGPNALRNFEFALGVIRGLGCDITTASSVVSTLHGYTLGAVQTELADRETWRRAEMTEDDWRAKVGPYIGRILDAGQHPHFADFVIHGVDQDYVQRFTFGLDCLIDGIAVRLRGRSGADRELPG